MVHTWMPRVLSQLNNMLNEINLFSIYDCRLRDCQLPDAIDALCCLQFAYIFYFILFYKEQNPSEYMDNVSLRNQCGRWGRKKHIHTQ